MATQCPDPNLFVIFGGTGDLTRNKLLPALCRLAADGGLGERCHVLTSSPCSTVLSKGEVVPATRGDAQELAASDVDWPRL